jgi:hypothetical protein
LARARIDDGDYGIVHTYKVHVKPNFVCNLLPWKMFFKVPL